MSLPRFFLSDHVIAAETQQPFLLRLSDEDVQHMRALRLQAGEHIAVIDAASDYFELEITEIKNNDIYVCITSHQSILQDGPSVMLVQGLAKGDRMDEVFRHATEVGVCAFMPLLCERSVVKLDDRKIASRMKRWESIVKSAAMQSGQMSIPEVLTPFTVSDAAAVLSEATAVLVCWEEAPASASLRTALTKALQSCICLPKDAKVAVVVGPEGGFTQDEVRILTHCNPRASLVTLGSTILRTETAGVVASALTLYELGGLGNNRSESNL